MSRQAESVQTNKKNTDLRPSPEIEAKMQPLARRDFDKLLGKAINKPSQQLAPKRR